MLFLLPWLLGIERFQADFILPHRPYQNPGFYHLSPNIGEIWTILARPLARLKMYDFDLIFSYGSVQVFEDPRTFLIESNNDLGFGNVQHFGFLNSPTFYFLQRYIGYTYVLHIFRIRYIHAYQNLLRAIFKNELLVALFEYFWISCKNCVTWIILSLLCMEKKRSKLSTTLEWLESRMSPECQPNTSDTDPELWRRNLTFNEEY